MANREGQQLGNYRLIRILGQGSFAEVYLSEHVYLKTESAVKVLHAQLANSEAESFLNEAQTIAHLVHPHIVRILDFDVQAGTPFLVMDYAPNGTLRQRHPRGLPMPLNVIVNYVKQVADALQYAHNQRLIHRDIKPENMLLGRRNEVLLSDFGIALASQSTLMEKTQPMAGTAAYMAPEQLHGKARLASDQYALGIVVYEWLSGDRPFQGSFTELASQQIFAPPPSLREKVPGISPSIEEVVMVALAKDPKQRFASVQAFSVALEQASFSTPSYRPGPTYAPATPILPLINSSPSSVSQPAQVQQQFPFTPIPPPPTMLPAVQSTGTDPEQAQQQPLHNTQLIQQRPISTDPSRVQEHLSRKKLWRNVFLLALTILIIGGALTTYFVFLHRSTTTLAPVINGIGVNQAPDGEFIGISDGSFAFDTNRSDGALKQQAADKLKAHDISGAESLWQLAIKQETNDAEALIYLEDQRVLASRAPYITLVVGTTLTGSSFYTGRDDLQGAYVAQKEYNDGVKLPGGALIRLLIANSGDKISYATTVAQQIVQAAQADKTVVGVMGWPASDSSGNVITILSAAHIPMVSPTAPFDSLTGVSTYFFRVIASVQRQVFVGTRYAEQTLHSTRAALFVDPTDVYSKEVAYDFEQQFVNDGNTVAAVENYTVGHQEMLPGLLQDALNKNPNLIYFAGYANDAGALMGDLPTTGQYAHLQVMGAGLFENYPPNLKPRLNRLHFTVFLTGGMWEFTGLSAKKPAFFTEYPQDFDPLKQHKGDAFGYTRADNDVMFSYDAMLALLTGSKIALAGLPAGMKNFTPGNLQQALTKITGSQAIQGVSGQISFGPDGNVINKTIVLVKFDARGNPLIDSVQGSFLLGS